MRHALLHRPTVRGGLARHRPRTPGWSRADAGRTKGTDIVLAVLGTALLGVFCLLVAARVIGPTLGS